MLTGILGALFDSIVKGVLGYFQGLAERRGLIQQGREAQHSADLEATVAEAKNAAKIDEHVAAEPIAAVDDDLERLRKSAAAPGGQ